jgi:hypothetical protein
MQWNFNADNVETCNCDYGCPCNFSGIPSNGFCNTLVLYHIREGSYGQVVSLGGLDAVYAASWPKAIHEGNGILQLLISKRATEEQRRALVSIMSGQAKGEGPFALFAGTMRFVLEPQFVDINTKIDGKKSSFSVPYIMDVQIENFKNPVTGDDTKIQLPRLFIWKLAVSSKDKDNAYHNTRSKS